MGQAVSKSTHSLTHSLTHLFFALLTVVIFTYCKEEPVQPQEETNTAEISAAKKASDAQLALQLDKDKTIDKEKFEKLKAEHEKPFALLKKPTDILQEYLIARHTSAKITSSNKEYNRKSIFTSCYQIETDAWVIDHYQPYPNKILGIDPKPSWQSNESILNTLHYDYGFNRIFVAETRLSYPLNAGFSSSEIAVVISDMTYFQTIMNTYDETDYHHCYINEPQELNSISYIQQVLTNNINAWHAKYPGEISLGIQSRVSANEFDELVNIVNSTVYEDWSKWPNEWDQRTDWSEWNQQFQSKFNGLWISGPSDNSHNQFDLLTGHAFNMGKSMVSLWFDGDSYSDNDCWTWISNFCYWSWLHYYLDRLERKYVYVWNYVGNSDPCYDDQITSWELINIYNTDETRMAGR